MTELFNEYYQLKAEYEETEQERIQKIMKNKKLSKLEKRNRFKKSKPLCIKCKEEGGTIFTTKFDEEELSREMIARCGHLQQPCDLYIRINCGSYTLLDQSIRVFEKDIERIKREIVVLKNKAPFGYKDDVTTEFDVLKDDLTSTTALLESNIRDFFIDETELNKLLELSFKLIDSIKELVIEGEFDDAVTIYIDNLLSNLKMLRETKYKLNLVTITESGYTLLQLPSTIDSVEQVLGEPTINRSRNVLRDSSQVLEKEKEDDVLEKDKDVLESVSFELTDNGVVFDNPKHKEIFDSLTEEYQMELLLEDDWLKETIAEYARTGKPYKFVAPTHLMSFPPKLKPDGTYDFGDTIYNEEFIKLPNKKEVLEREDLREYMSDLVGKRLLV